MHIASECLAVILRKDNVLSLYSLGLKYALETYPEVFISRSSDRIYRCSPVIKDLHLLVDRVSQIFHAAVRTKGSLGESAPVNCSLRDWSGVERPIPGVEMSEIGYQVRSGRGSRGKPG